ncbi:MAG TPA: hypothetical protein VD862_02640 [Candidatus Paceibacterota bacterium]|nr:hypothetical protein [Candidatus Paceibacterota bacterium]
MGVLSRLGLGRSQAPPRPLRHMVTLLPSFPHFRDYARDDSLDGIRINSAAVDDAELKAEFALLANAKPSVPVYFDIKGRQLRVTEVLPNTTHLDVRLNHPVGVPTPTVVLFKAGADSALLQEVAEDGHRLIFAPGAKHGPKVEVKVGDSLHIRNPDLTVGGNQFTELEHRKLSLAKEAGFTRWFLSYVQNGRDVQEFLDLVGRHDEVCLKIEDPKGLQYVAGEFKKRDNLSLVLARGDLYVEVDRPHDILWATRLVVERDPEAIVGSRLMLSMVNSKVPACVDFSELAWLYDVGYRRFMVCDELCLKRELLDPVMNAMDAFRTAYAKA